MTDRISAPPRTKTSSMMAAAAGGQLRKSSPGMTTTTNTAVERSGRDQQRVPFNHPGHQSQAFVQDGATVSTASADQRQKRAFYPVPQKSNQVIVMMIF